MGNSRSRPEQGLGSSPSKSLPVTYPALTAQSTQQSVLSFHEPDALEPHIAVHLHGVDLDEADSYNVLVSRRTGSSRVAAPAAATAPGRQPGIEEGLIHQRVQTAATHIQALLSLAVSCLTIGKLVEDIKFVRTLRRTLATISQSLPGSFEESSEGQGGWSSLPAPHLGPSSASGQVQPAGATAAAAAAAAARSVTDPGSKSLAPSSTSSGGAAGQACDSCDKNLGSHLDTLVSPLLPSRPQPQQDKKAQQGKGRRAPGVVAAASAVAAPAAPGQSPGGAPVSWASISGLEDVKQVLQEVCILPTLRPDLFQGIRRPPRGILLFGPPGTGKTLLARAVAAESGASFFSITGGSILSMWYGASEANVRQLFEKARRHQPSVIFIDEVDSLLGRRAGLAPGGGGADVGGGGADRRVANELLAFMDGIQTREADTQVCVLAASNMPWDLDEAALSRFARRIYVPLPGKEARMHLLKSALSGTKVDMTSGQWSQLADKCGKFSGRDLTTLCREAAMSPVRELWGGGLVDISQASGGQASEEVEARQRAAVRQRLVSAVAQHLQRGSGWRRARRLRKELARWRGRAGAAAEFVNVDEVMKAAADLREDQLRKQKQQEQEQKQGVQAARGQGPSTRQGTATTGPDAVPATTDSVQEQQGHADTRGGPVPVEGVPTGASHSPPMPSLLAQPPAAAAAAASDLAPAGSTDNQAAKDAVSAGTCCIDRARRPDDNDTPPAASQVRAPAEADTPRFTRSQLMSLPADSIRAVTWADFEQALARIKPTDFDLTARYEEFNLSYGSGADAKQEAHLSKYLHIYM